MAIEDFDKYLGNLKTYLPDVEDASFSWADVIGLLVIKLRNTDSLNKARTASHATQIQLTSESAISTAERESQITCRMARLSTSRLHTVSTLRNTKAWIPVPCSMHLSCLTTWPIRDKSV